MSPATKEYNRRYYEKNIDKARAASLRWYRANKEAAARRFKEREDRVNPWVERPCLVCGGPFTVRQSNRRKKYCGSRCASRARGIQSYGISVEDFRQLTATGRCPICQRKIKKWHVDHDHKTNETWGVICERCNTKVVAGITRDAEAARRLADYIANPPARALTGEPRFITPGLARRRASSRRRFGKGTTNGEV